MTVIALTGAAGQLASYLRAPLAALGSRLISTDLIPVEELAANEEFRAADLTDLDQVTEALRGADVVVHFGANGDEAPWDDIMQSNFQGAYTVWEAAHRLGIKRVVYASSIHAVGMYPRTQRIGVDTPHYPDSFYGLSKCFAENLARLYWDKRGIEAVCLRIYSCSIVNNERSLGSWLSRRDLVQLVEKSITCPVTGFAIIYGVSNNDRVPVDNEGARFLGYRPLDNAEEFAIKVLAEMPTPDPSDPAQMYHGGVFAKGDLGQSGRSMMNIQFEEE